jgi:hypothetical protein
VDWQTMGPGLYSKCLRSNQACLQASDAVF